MTFERAIDILQAEMTCVERQRDNPCSKEDCSVCDLAQDTDEILYAYDRVIALLEYMNKFSPEFDLDML